MDQHKIQAQKIQKLVEEKETAWNKWQQELSTKNILIIQKNVLRSDLEKIQLIADRIYQHQSEKIISLLDLNLDSISLHELIIAVELKMHPHYSEIITLNNDIEKLSSSIDAAYFCLRMLDGEISQIPAQNREELWRACRQVIHETNKKIDDKTEKLKKIITCFVEEKCKKFFKFLLKKLRHVKHLEKEIKKKYCSIDLSLKESWCKVYETKSNYTKAKDLFDTHPYSKNFHKLIIRLYIPKDLCNIVDNYYRS